jgi:GDPmannose 4,6-dehydratase
MPKTALITGIHGQDGFYLSRLLLEKGYVVYGMTRRSPTTNDLDQLGKEIKYVVGDLSDSTSLYDCIRESNPNEIYNLGGISSVGNSWHIPEKINNINGMGVLRLLETIKDYDKNIKFYQASTSEIYGKPENAPQNEKTQFYPRSPYGISKLFGHWVTKNYRESHNMFTCNGILFNHESERRKEEFVTRKISKGVAKIHLGLKDHITLGNIDGKRDWGYAPDFVEAMWLMLQQDHPDDYVIATEKSNSIRDFLNVAFGYIGIGDWNKYIKQDKRFMRPMDVDNLVGDCSKAKEILGWQSKVSFKEMAEKMVMNDIVLLKDGNV